MGEEEDNLLVWIMGEGEWADPNHPPPSAAAPLCLLPTLSFSSAYALKKLSGKKQSKGGGSGAGGGAGGGGAGGGDTLVAAMGGEADMEAAADDELLRALLLFPSALQPLASKAGLLAEGSFVGDFKAVLRLEPFRSSSTVKRAAGVGAVVDRLVGVFVERHYELWKAADIVQWLLQGAHQAVEVAKGDLVKMRRIDEVINNAFGGGGAIARRFPFVDMAAFSDTITSVPILPQGMDGGGMGGMGGMM